MNKQEARVKVAKLSSYSKLQWRKFDTEADGFMTDVAVILDLIQSSFDEANLKHDFDQFSQQINLGDVVNFYRDNAEEGKVTMAHIHEIILDLYQYKPQLKEQVPIAAESPSKAVKSDYKDYYQRIQAMAKDRQWTNEEITTALRNREMGERKYFVWFNSKAQNYKNAPEAPVIQRLMVDAIKQQAEKVKVENQRVRQEQSQAEKLANQTVNSKGLKIRSPNKFFKD